MQQDLSTFARAVRDRCVEQLRGAYEEAGCLGLCAEGRWEYAIDRVRHSEPDDLLKGLGSEGGAGAEI